MTTSVVVVPRQAMIPVRGVLINPRIVGSLTGLISHCPKARLSSGWRSVTHNREVGGAPRSRHLAGVAVDVVGSTADLAELARQAPRHGATEVIFEGDHLHVGWPRPLAL